MPALSVLLLLFLAVVVVVVDDLRTYLLKPLLWQLFRACQDFA